MLAFLEEGSPGAKSRWRQQWRYYGSHRTLDTLKLGLDGVQQKDSVDEANRGASGRIWMPCQRVWIFL